MYIHTTYFLRSTLLPKGGQKKYTFFPIVKLGLDTQFEINLIKNVPFRSINKNNVFLQFYILVKMTKTPKKLFK